MVAALTTEYDALRAALESPPTRTFDPAWRHLDERLFSDEAADLRKLGRVQRWIAVEAALEFAARWLLASDPANGQIVQNVERIQRLALQLRGVDTPLMPSILNHTEAWLSGALTWDEALNLLLIDLYRVISGGSWPPGWAAIGSWNGVGPTVDSDLRDVYLVDGIKIQMDSELRLAFSSPTWLGDSDLPLPHAASPWAVREWVTILISRLPFCDGLTCCLG